MKECSGCGEVKPFDSFYLYREIYYTGKCKACISQASSARFKEKYHGDPELRRHISEAKKVKYREEGPNRDVHLKYMYGISEVHYQALLDFQNGACAICGMIGEPKPRIRLDGGNQHLAVDHDHATGRIRGLLCRACNSALGAIEEDIFLIEKAIAYLQKHHGLE